MSIPAGARHRIALSPRKSSARRAFPRPAFAQCWAPHIQTDGAHTKPLAHDERQHAVLYLTEQRHWSVDRAARIIGLRADQVRPVPADDSFRLTPTALSPDGSLLLTWSHDASLRLWDSQTGKEVAAWKDHTDRITSAHSARMRTLGLRD